MPPIQILPAIPTFGSKLAQTLGGAGANIAQGFEKRAANKKLQGLLAQFAPQETQAAATAGQGNPPAPGQPMQGQPSAKPKLNPLTGVSIREAAVPVLGEKGADLLVDRLYKEQDMEAEEASKIRLQNAKNQSAVVKKLQEKNQGAREAINKQRLDLKTARNAVQSGETGAFSLNSFADLFGEAGKRLKTAKGAQLDSAVKGLLFDSVNEVTAKATNLWLEKVALSALPGLGKSDESNDTLITIALGKLDIAEKKLDLEDEIIQKYEQLGVTPPSNVDKLANDLLKPYAKRVEEQMAYDTRVIYEKEKGERYLNNLEKVPKGTPLTKEKRDALIKKAMKDPSLPISESTPEERKKAKVLAEKLGYEIPSYDPSGEINNQAVNE